MRDGDELPANWRALEAENARLRKELEAIAEDDKQPSHPCGPQQYGYFGNKARSALASETEK